MTDVRTPPWMEESLQGLDVKPLDAILPHIEESLVQHSEREEDGDVRPLVEVLNETVWDSVPPEPASSGMYDDGTDGAPAQDQTGPGQAGTEDVQPSEQGFVPPDSSGEPQPSEPVVLEPAPGPSAYTQENPQEAEPVAPFPREELSRDIEAVIREEAETIFEEERRRAWQSVEAEVVAMRARLTESLRKLEEKSREIVGSFDDNYLKLLEYLVKSITYHELTVSREGLRKIVEESVSLAGMDGNVVVRLSPDDYEYLMLNESEWFEKVSREGTMTIEVDEALSPGDCVVETPTGRVDNTVETRIRKVLEAVYDAADTPE